MGWIIFIDILLIIIIALFLSVQLNIRIDDEIRIKLKYAGITIFSVSPENEEKRKKKQEKKKKDKSLKKIKKEDKSVQSTNNTDNTNSADSKPSEVSGGKTDKRKSGKSSDSEDKKGKSKSKSGGDFSEKWEMIKLLLDSAGRPAKRLISHIRVTDFYADITASGEDAAQAALNYGKINWMVYSALSYLYQFVQLKVKKIDIGVNFSSGETKYFISCKVKMRLSTAIGCALWFFGRAAKRYINKMQGGQVSQVRRKGT